MAIESIGVSLVGSLEAYDFVLFLHHGLYGSDSREVLLDVGTKFGKLFLHLPGRDPHLAFRALGIKENKRHRRQDTKRQQRREIQHEGECHQRREYHDHEQDSAARD